MRCVTARDQAPASPAKILAVGCVAEALTAGDACAYDEIFFTGEPFGGDRLAALPEGVPVHVPYREELLPRYAGRAGGVVVHVEADRAEPGVLLCLSRLGLDASVDGLGAVTPERARRLADLFLRDPGITRGVEPFSSLLRAITWRHTCSLWEVLGPAPAVRVYVSRDGRVGATPGSIQDHVSVAEFVDRWKTSAAGRAVDAFLIRLPQNEPACLACPFFCFCQGHAAWAGGCRTWRAVFAVLSAAARELRATLRPLLPSPEISPM
jgi:hypothetical protein